LPVSARGTLCLQLPYSYLARPAAFTIMQRDHGPMRAKASGLVGYRGAELPLRVSQRISELRAPPKPILTARQKRCGWLCPQRPCSCPLPSLVFPTPFPPIVGRRTPSRTEFPPRCFCPCSCSGVANILGAILLLAISHTPSPNGVTNAAMATPCQGLDIA